MAGLFDIFTTATRGLNVQQGAISTTSHNIANANTAGYSRQRAVIETTRPFGAMSRFDSCSVGQMGTGAEITSIQRIRDSFIDYQIRSESGTSGYYTNISDTLSKAEDVFAEPSDQGMEELMTKFFTAFQEISKPNSGSDVKAAAIKQASALADQINYAYNQLQKYKEDSQTTLDSNVTDINSYLDQINELNKQIRSVSAVGETANDLMDKRDNLLDEIGYKFGIKIDKDKLDTINLSSTEYPNNPLVKSDPNDTGYNRFSYVKSVDYIKKSDGTYDVDANGAYKGITIEYYPLGNENAPTQSFNIGTDSGTASNVSTDNQTAKDLINELTQNRILLADKDGNVSTTTSSPATTISPAPSPLPTNGLTTSGTTQTLVKTVTSGNIQTITQTTSPINDSIIPATMTTVTITHDLTGSVADSATQVVSTKAAPTTASDVKALEFVTYKYESGINNVDNNNIKGEIAGNQKVQEDLDGMMDNLNRLAESLAYSVNAIQTGSITAGTTTQGLEDNPVFINGDASTVTDTGITAKNIKINSALVSDPTKLSSDTSSTSGTDGKRAAAIANLASLKMNISDIPEGTDFSTMTREEFLKAVGIDSTTNFTDSATNLNLNAGTDGSTLDSYYKSLTNSLGVEVQEANRKVDTQDVVLAKLQNDKTQQSGVSLDEETTNLIQFQHAYQANAKMISTINDLLDVVINGLMK